jgi:hypothetical protein
MFKKIGIGIVVALIVAAVGVGVVLAQGSTPVTEIPTEASDPVGPRGDHGPGGRGGKHGPMGGGQLDIVAEALGMTTEELREALAGGQTIADLAEAKGVALEDIAAALVAEHAEHLQQAVEDGRLTQEEADERIAEMQTKILEQLESGEFGGPAGPGAPGGCGGPGGMGGGSRGSGMHRPRLSDSEAPDSEE